MYLGRLIGLIHARGYLEKERDEMKTFDDFKLALQGLAENLRLIKLTETKLNRAIQREGDKPYKYPYKAAWRTKARQPSPSDDPVTKALVAD